MVEKNVHQQKKDLIKEINFFWHSPKVTSEVQLRALGIMQEALALLQNTAIQTEGETE